MPQRDLHEQEPIGLHEKASCNIDCLEGRDLPPTRWGENGERKRHKRPEWQKPKWVALLTVKCAQHNSCCVVQYTSNYFCFICEQVEVVCSDLTIDELKSYSGLLKNKKNKNKKSPPFVQLLHWFMGTLHTAVAAGCRAKINPYQKVINAMFEVRWRTRCVDNKAWQRQKQSY